MNFKNKIKFTAKGCVVKINNKRGMIVVMLEDGSYSVLEILGYDDIEIGTTVKGSIDDEGSCTISNLDTKTSIDVVVQNAGCGLNQAMKRANLI